MKTRNAMQLKSFIKTRAIELNLRPQQMLHTYYMECFVNRLAHSNYVDNFILKGGYLISNLIGFQARTTMDVDTTVKNFPIDESAMTAALTHVCQVPVEDDFTFELDHLERIREEDDYQGLRAFLNVSYGEIRGTLTMDITAGDSIYPGIQQMFFKEISTIRSSKPGRTQSKTFSPKNWRQSSQGTNSTRAPVTTTMYICSRNSLSLMSRP